MAFPDTEGEWEIHAALQPVAEQLANVFNGRVGKEVIPRAVIVFTGNVPDRLFKIGEIDDHAIAQFALDNDLEFVGVAVESPAFRVSWQKVSTIDVFGHTKFHGVRIAHATVLYRGAERRGAAECRPINL